jgi:hypothetical protein
MLSFSKKMPENPFSETHDPLLAAFIKGKSDQTMALLHHFYDTCSGIANISLHPAKSMISIRGANGKVWVTRLGRNFVHIVFPFKEPYQDNLCFMKIAQVPGQQQFNHHFRMQAKEDVNEEVKTFLAMALK